MPKRPVTWIKRGEIKKTKREFLRGMFVYLHKVSEITEIGIKTQKNCQKV
jgi:hypothetical protein